MQNINSNKYNLEQRTLEFAKNVRIFIKSLYRVNTLNIIDIKQLIRSSGSIAANYIEANESFSKKDFFYRVKICRKEAKESVLWLNLIECNTIDNEKVKTDLIEECTQLMKIFGSIVVKSKKTSD